MKSGNIRLGRVDVMNIYTGQGHCTSEEETLN